MTRLSFLQKKSTFLDESTVVDPPLSILRKSKKIKSKMLCFRSIINYVKYEEMEPGVLLGPCPICPEADASQVSPASQEVSLGKMPSGMGLIYFPTFSKVWSLTLSFFRFEFSRLSLNEAK